MDSVTRIMAERMRVPLGQAVVVENISGANGNIGVGRVARATPDGYTLIVGNWNSQVAKRSPVYAPIRSVEGFRADCADRELSSIDHRAHFNAGG
jgi:hypothetical protein